MYRLIIILILIIFSCSNIKTKRYLYIESGKELIKADTTKIKTDTILHYKPNY